MSKSKMHKVAAELLATLFDASGRFSDERARRMHLDDRITIALAFTAVHPFRIPIPVSIVSDEEVAAHAALNQAVQSYGMWEKRVIHGVLCRGNCESFGHNSFVLAPRSTNPVKPVKDTRSLRQLLSNHLGYSDDKPLFIAAARKYMKAVAVEFPGATVSVNEAGIACSGDISLVIPGVFYAVIGQSVCGNLMARFGKQSFATDGRNEWLDATFLDAPENLVRWIQKRLESRHGDSAPRETDAVNAAIFRAAAPIRPESAPRKREAQMELFAA